MPTSLILIALCTISCALTQICHHLPLFHHKHTQSHLQLIIDTHKRTSVALQYATTLANNKEDQKLSLPISGTSSSSQEPPMTFSTTSTTISSPTATVKPFLKSPMISMPSVSLGAVTSLPMSIRVVDNPKELHDVAKKIVSAPQYDPWWQNIQAMRMMSSAHTPNSAPAASIPLLNRLPHFMTSSTTTTTPPSSSSGTIINSSPSQQADMVEQIMAAVALQGLATKSTVSDDIKPSR